MVYTVGISTGFWKIGRDPGLLGLAQKIGGLGATGGVRFVQIDLEMISEFYEPDLKKQIETMKDKLGLTVGLHGEIGELMALDSAEKRIWEQTHIRLCQTVKFAADFKFLYVNVHFSNRQFLQFTEAQQRQGIFYPVVGPNGKGIQTIVEGNPQTKDVALEHIGHYFQDSKTYRDAADELYKQKLSQLERTTDEVLEAELKQIPHAPTPAERQTMRERIRGQVRQALENEYRHQVNSTEFSYTTWLKLKPEEFARYLLNDGEVGAYTIVATWMKEKGDPLWSAIANGKDPAHLYFGNEDEVMAFHAAVASKYIEGHLTLTDHAANQKYLGGMSVKAWCEKHGLYFLLENPESGEGAEGLYRLFHPQHFYHLIKQLGSSHIKITIDPEHLVSQKLNPDDILPGLPGDFGSLVFLLHLGQALPYGGTAHIPIARGSLAQEQIYRWLYILRKKGWKQGHLMFERGSGRGGGKTPYEVFEDSVAALRLVAKYLDLGTAPKDLPPEFYGVTFDNPGVFKKQIAAIHDHAEDPLEGVFMIPEEKHTFLGGSAVAKQKGQEWEKRRYR